MVPDAPGRWGIQRPRPTRSRPTRPAGPPGEHARAVSAGAAGTPRPEPRRHALPPVGEGPEPRDAVRGADVLVGEVWRDPAARGRPVAGIDRHGMPHPWQLVRLDPDLARRVRELAVPVGGRRLLPVRRLVDALQRGPRVQQPPQVRRVYCRFGAALPEGYPRPGRRGRGARL